MYFFIFTILTKVGPFEYKRKIKRKEKKINRLLSIKQNFERREIN